MNIKARDDFGQVVARAGLTRTELSRLAGVSTQTLDILSNPQSYRRTGYTRQVTAWKIANAFADYKGQTSEEAFDVLFVKEP